VKAYQDQLKVTEKKLADNKLEEQKLHTKSILSFT
jgi:hypothetical protein